MDIEQIALFVAGWFAVGFVVALALGKILREATEPDRLDADASLVVGKALNTPPRRASQRQPVRKNKRAKSAAASL